MTIIECQKRTRNMSIFHNTKILGYMGNVQCENQLNRVFSIKELAQSVGHELCNLRTWV
jgi:hypothetical protein